MTKEELKQQEEHLEDEEFNEEADLEENEDLNEQEEEQQEDEEEDVAAIKKQLEDERKKNLTLEKQKKHWRKVAKEGGNKDAETLTSADIIAIVKADIADEDMELVQRTAKVLDVSIAEALKDPYLKNALDGRKEERKTADATNTKKVRSGSKGISDEQILQNFAKGEIPEAGTPEAKRLYELRSRKQN